MRADLTSNPSYTKNKFVSGLNGKTIIIVNTINANDITKNRKRKKIKCTQNLVPLLYCLILKRALEHVKGLLLSFKTLFKKKKTFDYALNMYKENYKLYKIIII